MNDRTTKARYVSFEDARKKSTVHFGELDRFPLNKQRPPVKGTTRRYAA